MRMRPATRFIIGVAVLAVAASTSWAGIVLPSLPAGSQYQIVFVTADGVTATSANIADYNKFAAEQAAQSEDLPKATWNAVVSTTNTQAKNNAPSAKLPVYNTAGQKLADGDDGLYVFDLAKAIGYDQFGKAKDTKVWTGSDAMGEAVGNHELGAKTKAFEYGLSTSADSEWMSAGNAGGTPGYPYNLPLPIYVLSSTITVPVPEPRTIVLLLVGGALILLRRFAQRA